MTNRKKGLRKTGVAACAVLGMTATGCRATPPSDTPEVSAMRDQRPNPMPPILLGLPIVSRRVEGRDVTPEAYKRGARLFRQAMDAETDESGRDKAAHLFLTAAESFVPDADGEFEEHMAACRNVAYFNAWQCFLAADQADAGRQALTAAARNDPKLAKRISEILLMK